MASMAILAVFTMAAAACGSDDDSSSVEVEATDGSTESTEGSTDGSASESMEPIKMMTIAPIETQLAPYPSIEEGSKIYEQYINDRGGIAGGHPLEVIFCDSKGDPNEAAACAREAVNEGVVAVVGHFEYDLSSAVPILEEAGIALFGSCCPVSPAEFTSPVNFIFGSTNAMQHAATYLMQQEGCEAPGYVYIDIYSDYLTGLAKEGQAYYGAFEDNAKFVSVPLEVGDFSPQAAEVDGTDCLWLSLGPAHSGAFLAGMQSVGSEQRVFGAQGNFTQEVAQGYPELAVDGVVLNAYPNLSDPVWDEFRAAIDEYGAGTDTNFDTLSGLGVWAAYVAANDIASLIEGEITADSFLDTALQQDAYQSMWGPVIDLSQDGPMPAFPRVLNVELTYDRINEQGELVPSGEFVDMTPAVSGS
jgi:ABC-type branched-subunit amino acid transport system substrate-binding protein